MRTVYTFLVVVFASTLPSATVGAQSTSAGMKGGPRSADLEAVLKLLESEIDGNQSVAAKLQSEGFDPRGLPLQLTDDRAIFDGSYFFDGRQIIYQTGSGFIDSRKYEDGSIRSLIIGRLGEKGVDKVEFAYARATSPGSVGYPALDMVAVLYSKTRSLELRRKGDLWIATVWPGDSGDTTPIRDVVGTIEKEGDTEFFRAEDGSRYTRSRLSYFRDIALNSKNGIDYVFIRISAADGRLGSCRLIRGETHLFSESFCVVEEGRITGPTLTEAAKRPSQPGTPVVTEARMSGGGNGTIYEGKLVFALPVLGFGAPALLLAGAVLLPASDEAVRAVDSVGSPREESASFLIPAIIGIVALGTLLLLYLRSRKKHMP